MSVLRPGLKAVMVVALGLISSAAFASTGTVTELSGTLSVLKVNGSVRILSQKSEVVSGDTLNTQKDSYVQIKFSDGGEVTMKPNTSVKIRQFYFRKAEPAKDSFVFDLVKGGCARLPV